MDTIIAKLLMWMYPYYDWGAGARGCEAADYPHEVSACEGQELGG